MLRWQCAGPYSHDACLGLLDSQARTHLEVHYQELLIQLLQLLISLSACRTYMLCNVR